MQTRLTNQHSILAKFSFLHCKNENDLKMFYMNMLEFNAESAHI